ncbi:MAG: lytic transglycosylase domain-containing protein [Bdellovibrionia bacterium]
MLKYLKRSSFWSWVILGQLFWSQVDLIEADPTDDFSFSLPPTLGTQHYRFLSERRVTEILRDHLDLFPDSQVPRLAKHLIGLCQKHRFDPAFVLSLIQVESRFRVKAVSPVGAYGLMQVMPSTAQFVIRQVGVVSSGFETFKHVDLKKMKLTAQVLMDPYLNTAIGMAYLAWLRDHYHGHLPYHMVGAYNMGPAKLDGLIHRKDFQPVKTKKYFLDIRRATAQIHFKKSLRPTRSFRTDSGWRVARSKLKRKRKPVSRPCALRSPMV